MLLQVQKSPSDRDKQLAFSYLCSYIWMQTALRAKRKPALEPTRSVLL